MRNWHNTSMALVKAGKINHVSRASSGNLPGLKACHELAHHCLFDGGIGLADPCVYQRGCLAQATPRPGALVFLAGCYFGCGDRRWGTCDGASSDARAVRPGVAVDSHSHM